MRFWFQSSGEELRAAAPPQQKESAEVAPRRFPGCHPLKVFQVLLQADPELSGGLICVLSDMRTPQEPRGGTGERYWREVWTCSICNPITNTRKGVDGNKRHTPGHELLALPAPSVSRGPLELNHRTSSSSRVTLHSISMLDPSFTTMDLELEGKTSSCRTATACDSF